VNHHTPFRGEADGGFCAAKEEDDFGFPGLVLTTVDGVIAGVALTAANVDERDALLERIRGALLSDKGFIRPLLTEEWSEMDIEPHPPLRKNRADSRPPSLVALLVLVRRRVETVIGQLAERFSAEWIGARQLWQWVTRLYRKIAAHTLCVLINPSLGRPLLDFEGLVTESKLHIA